MNLREKIKHSSLTFPYLICSSLTILIYILYKLPEQRSSDVTSVCEKNYTFTSAGMSGGKKWEDFRWEDGWSVERVETTMTGETRTDGSTAPGEPGTGDEPGTSEEMNLDPEVERSSSNTTVQVNTCSDPPQAADASIRSGASGTTDNWQDQSVLSESEDDDTSYSDKVDLGSGYLQCRAAREAANVDSFTNISCNEKAMQIEQKTGDKVGSMDIALDRDIEGCFKGSRIEKNGILVNQFLSSSFNPATHICITCSNVHSILGGGGGPDCFVLADQNFVATLLGTDSKNCSKIVRVENASLSELSGIFIEIMENKFIKPGSVS